MIRTCRVLCPLRRAVPTAACSTAETRTAPFMPTRNLLSARFYSTPSPSPSTPSPSPSDPWSRFWQWTTQKRPAHDRWSAEWIREGLIVLAIFSVAGSSTLYFVRPCLGYIGIEGSMMEGPWSYRVASFFMISPIYTLIVLTVGTLAGRHPTFAKVAARMWKRFLPNSMRLKLMCEPARRLQ